MLLELRQEKERVQLISELYQVYESIRPINMIKSTINEIVYSQEIRNNLLNTSIVVATSCISKTLFKGVSHSPIRKLLGTALMFGVTNFITKNPEAIQSLTDGIFREIKNKMSNKSSETGNTEIPSIITNV